MKKYVSYGLITSLSMNAFGTQDSDGIRERLFGTPGSVTEGTDTTTNKLRLNLSKSSIPREVWDDLEKLTRAWGLFGFGIHSPQDHQNLLRFSGLSEQSIKKLSGSHEFQILSAMSDQHLLTLAKNGDYAGLLLELKSRDLVGSYEKSELAIRFQALLEKDAETRANMRNVLSDSKNNNIIELQKLIGPGDGNEPACIGVVVCVTLVAVATYALAAVNAGVVLNVAGWISVATEIAIWVSGGGPPGHGDNCSACHTNSIASVGIPKMESIGKLDPSMMSNLSIFKQFSILTNSPELHTKALLDYKKTEARAVLTAAENLGMLTIKESDRDAVLKQLDKVVEESLDIL